jgi:hypothetical protein
VPTGVSSGSYGDAVHVGTFTVNAFGQLTVASSILSGWPPSSSNYSNTYAATGSDTSTTTVSVTTDNAQTSTGFANNNFLERQFFVLDGQNSITQQSKTTFIADAIITTMPAAGQRIARNVTQYGFGCGDNISDGLTQYVGGGVSAPGDEGQKEVRWAQIQIQNLVRANVLSVTAPSGLNTTITQNVVASNLPQTVTVASTAGAVAGYAVTNPGLPGSDTNAEASYLTIGSGTVTGIFRENHTSGATIVGTQVLNLDGAYEFGQQRYARIVTSAVASAYSTGTAKCASGATTVNGSGTTWTAGMAGGSTSYQIGLIWFHEDVTTVTSQGLFGAQGQTTDLNGSINAVVTSLVVDSSANMPLTPFYAQVGTEICLVTAVSGTTWTVVRGVLGSVAAIQADEASVYALGVLVPCYPISGVTDSTDLTFLKRAQPGVAGYSGNQNSFDYYGVVPGAKILKVVGNALVMMPSAINWAGALIECVPDVSVDWSIGTIYCYPYTVGAVYRGLSFNNYGSAKMGTAISVQTAAGNGGWAGGISFDHCDVSVSVTNPALGAINLPATMAGCLTWGPGLPSPGGTTYTAIGAYVPASPSLLQLQFAGGITVVSGGDNMASLYVTSSGSTDYEMFWVGNQLAVGNSMLSGTQSATLKLRNRASTLDATITNTYNSGLVTVNPGSAVGGGSYTFQPGITANVAANGIQKVTAAGSTDVLAGVTTVHADCTANVVTVKLKGYNGGEYVVICKDDASGNALHVTGSWTINGSGADLLLSAQYSTLMVAPIPSIPDNRIVSQR